MQSSLCEGYYFLLHPWNHHSSCGLSVTLPEQEGREAGPWPAQTTLNSLALSPRDLRSVVAQALMVRVGSLWQATSSLYTLSCLKRGTLGYMSS